MKKGAIRGPVRSGRFGCFIYAGACDYALYGEGAAASKCFSAALNCAFPRANLIIVIWLAACDKGAEVFSCLAVTTTANVRFRSWQKPSEFGMLHV